MLDIRKFFAAKSAPAITGIAARKLTAKESAENRTGDGWRRLVFTYEDGTVREGALILTSPRAFALQV